MKIARYCLAGGWIIFATCFLGGCKMFSDSFEAASQLDQKGQKKEALKAYQDYLKHHPQSSLIPRIYLRIASIYQGNSEYEDALNWYKKIDSEFRGTPENLCSLLNTADLYRNQLKDQAKAEEFSQKALELCFSDRQIHDAVQTVIISQLGAATNLFYQKKFKESEELVRTLVEAYPSSSVSVDLKAKVEALQDRIRRTELIAGCDATALWLKSEVPYNNSFTIDFPAPGTGAESGLLSPDGKSMISRRKAKNNTFYLYLANVTPNSTAVTFKLLSQTFGAEVPTWSPDSQSLVYERVVGKLRKLEKTSLIQKTTRTLFYLPKTAVPNLGFHPAYHPAGNKIAFVYNGKMWVMNGDGLNVTLLKTKQKFDYTSELSWSIDGTMIRCKQSGTVPIDDCLILDATTFTP